MVNPALRGALLACAGALILAPDTMFMRLSELSGGALIAWRGLLMAFALFSGWAYTSRTHSSDLRQLFSRYGLLAALFYGVNAIAFSLGVAAAPAAVVLFAVATVPIFAALHSWWLLGEGVSIKTYVTMLVVLLAIGFSSVEDLSDFQLGIDIWGILAGLIVANMLALNFILFRAKPEVPILLSIGLGAFVSGIIGFIMAGSAAMVAGNLWAIFIAGGFILPVSFFLLSYAARFTHAAIVSLFLLLETALGPIFVWVVIGEKMHTHTIIAGVVIIAALLHYLWPTKRS